VQADGICWFTLFSAGLDYMLLLFILQIYKFSGAMAEGPKSMTRAGGKQVKKTKALLGQK